MKIYYIYSSACINCAYISLLIKKYNLVDYIISIEVESKRGNTFKEKYNLTRVPTILIVDNDTVVYKNDNVERKDIALLNEKISKNL